MPRFHFFVCDFQVYLYGAHVTSWKNDHAEELLFLSSKVQYETYLYFSSQCFNLVGRFSSFACKMKGGREDLIDFRSDLIEVVKYQFSQKTFLG